MNEEKKLWLTDLVLTKAMVAALVRRGILAKEDLLEELSHIPNTEATAEAIKDAEQLIRNLGIQA